MNSQHDTVCPTPEWAAFMQDQLLPEVTRDLELGTRMLEIGPGPGATTDWLRDRVEELVAVELEPPAAAALAQRFADTNVEVHTGDATQLPFADASFDSVACFTMLHHVPTAAGQNAVLAEALRVLRPGGVLVGSDSIASVELHHFHEGDVYNPIDPGTMVTRLQALSYVTLRLTVDLGMTFSAHAPR